MTDQELAARARDGDQDAFEQLVRDNEKRIYTLALRMTGSREDALDLAQDAFFQAWKALPTFQGESSFATWLYRLATNLCLDHLEFDNRSVKLFALLCVLYGFIQRPLHNAHGQRCHKGPGKVKCI